MVFWLARNDDMPRFTGALKLGGLWQKQMIGDTGNPEKKSWKCEVTMTRQILFRLPMNKSQNFYSYFFLVPMF